MILGMTDSLGQTWWQSPVRNLAGGKALHRVSTSIVRLSSSGIFRVPWNQFFHRRKGVFQDEASDSTVILVPGHNLDCKCTTQALPIYHNPCVLQISAMTEILKARLAVDQQAFLVRLASGGAVASIFQHKHVATDVLLQTQGNGHAMSDIARIAMQHQNSHVGLAASVSWPDQICCQYFAIRRWDPQVLIIIVAEFFRSGYICSGTTGQVSGVDQLTKTASAG